MKFLSRKFIISVLSLVCMIIFFVLKYISEISFVILYSVLMIVYLVVEGVLDLKKISFSIGGNKIEVECEDEDKNNTN